MITSSADQRRERWVKTVYVERDSPFWALLFTGFFVLGLFALIDRSNRIAELEARIRDLTPPQPVLVGQNQVMGTRTVPALTTGGAWAGHRNTDPDVGLRVNIRRPGKDGTDRVGQCMKTEVGWVAVASFTDEPITDADCYGGSPETAKAAPATGAGCSITLPVPALRPVTYSCGGTRP